MPRTGRSRHRAPSAGKHRHVRRSFPWRGALLWVGIAIAVAVFLVQARRLWFTQDDAFISYRYARNALDGQGLVFNTGERIEGYTNFFWVIILLLGGKLGFSFDGVAKTLGQIAGVGLIVLAGVWLRSLWRELHWGDGTLPGIAAALVVGCNGSLSYWAVSGLETAWFALSLTLSVWLWERRSWLVIPALAVTVMTRPEGVLVWGVLVIAEWVWGDGLRRSLGLVLSVLVLLAPLVLFKVLYYGSLLPNPFFAKTGLGWEYVAGGLDYTWLYLRRYGVYGLVPLLLVLALWRLRGRDRVVPVLWFIYTLYITLVGGDVLKAHRFFVPVTVLMSVSAGIGIGFLVRRFANRHAVEWMTAVLLSAVAVWTVVVPRGSLERIRLMEIGLVNKMTVVAGKLRETDARPFSIAASTIGKLSYDLAGHRVIDMLGLTDSVIARHPEVIPGNVSSWRERNFNATYVLSQDPDYILFSTGHKPSAPAERALVLHSKFRRNYYASLYWAPEIQRMLAVYKRKGEFAGRDSVWPSIRLAQDINQAWNFSLQKKDDSAMARMLAIKRYGPRDFSIPDQFIADRLQRAGQFKAALAYADSALAIDSFSVSAWLVKATIDQKVADTTALRTVLGHMQRIVPWLVSR